jgi:adenosine kinase
MKNNIDYDKITIIEEELTASAYIITDQADNQITGFNPGAMKYPSSFNFDEINPKESIAIIAPGNLEDMMKYSVTCKARGIDFIFDPGQSLPMWDSQNLTQCVEGSKILISNDYELELVIDKTGLDKKELLQLTNCIIVTLGDLGSRVFTPDCEMDIPAIKPKKVVDPTGAGDAYRAGLIKGLIQCSNIEQSAKMGSVCASFAVECYGTQEYHFSLTEFEERLSSAP